MRKLSPHRTTILSDLTGTLIRQRANGFAAELRTILRSFVDQGGSLVVVTNDSFEAVEHYFLEPLGRLTKDFFVISSGGAEGRIIGSADIELLFDSPAIPPTARNLAIGTMAAAIANQIEPAGRLKLEPLIKELAFSDQRVSLAGISDAFQTNSCIEVIKNKIALFFLDQSIASAAQKKIMDDVANNHELIGSCQKHGLHITQGANYLDITSALKRDGISRLLASPRFTENWLASEAVITLGDSANDLGLLTFNFPSQLIVRRIFVGEDLDVRDALIEQFPNESIIKEGWYCERMTEVLAEQFERI